MVLQHLFYISMHSNSFHRTTGARPLPSFYHTHTHTDIYIYIIYIEEHIFSGIIHWTVIPNSAHSGHNIYSYGVSSVEECLERCKAHDTCLSAEYRKISTPLCQVSGVTPVTLQLEWTSAFDLYVPCFMRRSYGGWTDGMVQSRFGIQKAIAMHFPLS